MSIYVLRRRTSVCRSWRRIAERKHKVRSCKFDLIGQLWDALWKHQ